MSQPYINIFQAARITAGLTQESVAEQIDISAESIKAYESGVRRPKPTIIRRMIEVYKAPFLEAQYAMQDEILSAIMPPLRQEPLIKSIAIIFKENKDAQSLIEELFDIAYSGAIQDQQRQRYNELREELYSFAGTILSLKYAIE